MEMRHSKQPPTDDAPDEYVFGADSWLSIRSDGELRWRHALIGQCSSVFLAIDQARVWADCATPLRSVLPGDFVLVTEEDASTVAGVEFILDNGLTLGACHKNFYLIDRPYPTVDDPDPMGDETILTVGDFVAYLVLWAKQRVM